MKQMPISFYIFCDGEKRLIEVDEEELILTLKKVVCGLTIDDDIDGFTGLAKNYLENAGLDETYAGLLTAKMKLWAVNKAEKIINEGE